MKDGNSIEIGKRIKKIANYLVYIDEIELPSGLMTVLSYDKTNSSKCFGGDRKYANMSFVDKLCDKYSIFNKDWLLTGNGEMLKAGPSGASSVSATVNGSMKGVIGSGVLNNGNINGNGNNVGMVPADCERKLVRAEAEIDILKKKLRESEAKHKQENEILKNMLEQAITDKEKAIIDKDRAMSMLDKALSR